MKAIASKFIMDENLMIERTFKDISDEDLEKADQQHFLVNMGWSRGSSWLDLLKSKRVLIISEAGAGKTYECRERARDLYNAGEPAFFIELATLALKDLRNTLDDEEEVRLDAWLSSQSGIATFFLDSIDELKLTRVSFEQALKSLKRTINSHLNRVRLVITTRPTPFHQQLVKLIFPIPPAVPTNTSEEAFADIAMGITRKKSSEKNSESKEWRTVALMPLSDSQIVEFANSQGIANSETLFKELAQRNALSFVRRPQDLIELCADWRDQDRIRTHREQVIANVHVKLLPRNERPEPAELSNEKAFEGATRLALAMLLTRRLTIRHNAASDDIQDNAAIDPAFILQDWNPSERKALLERALFTFASYGRVRFHHRSVIEFLAAERLQKLRKQRMPFRSLKRLLFSDTRDKTIALPSMRPVTGWLANKENGIFEILRNNEPAVLFDEGDPESLTQIQRSQALVAYVERYGTGGWRGLDIPHTQLYRFASQELATDIIQLWNTGIENPDVRQILLSIVEAGSVKGCADMVHVIACNPSLPILERLIALRAMMALADARLKNIASVIPTKNKHWPDKIVRKAIVLMFPRYMSVEELCNCLSWLKKDNNNVWGFSQELPRLIMNIDIGLTNLEKLRDRLMELITSGLRWQEEWPHIVCDNSHLNDMLAAACGHGLKLSQSDKWLHASFLTLRLRNREYGHDDTYNILEEKISNFNAVENSRFFWVGHRLIQSLKTIIDPWGRLVELTIHDRPVKLRADRDLEWIIPALTDTTGDADYRYTLFEAAMHLSQSSHEWQENLIKLKLAVVGTTDFIATIDNRIELLKNNEQLKVHDSKRANRQKNKEHQQRKDHASWIQFWREIANHPDKAFSPEKSENTAWNLWKAMSQDGETSRSSGWNRNFLEIHFGKSVADKLRLTLMKIWRKDLPILKNEKSKNKSLVHWEFGLTAIYAEAENLDWAKNLNEEEVRLASRFAFQQLNELPFWIEGLINNHPELMDEICGKALISELEKKPEPNSYAMLLQSITYTSAVIANKFLPHIESWLEKNGDVVNDESSIFQGLQRLRNAIKIILTHGDEPARIRLLVTANTRIKNRLIEEFKFIWVSTLIRLNPKIGIDIFEKEIENVAVEKYSKAVTWFSVLFGDWQEAIDLHNESFTSVILLKFLRLAYYHIRPSDDETHEGTFTANVRDNAERARNSIVNALLDLRGEEGWIAKLEMANEPVCNHFRDRILAVAEERWAEEVDNEVLTISQVNAIDKVGEAAASSNAAMFAIMNDRLADIDELLLQDFSPREAWAGIKQERIMRREVTRVLDNMANGIYKVNQESVTADEKETDMRLFSVLSDHEAIIELKLAENWSAIDLQNTIQSQLVKKYMAPANRRAGCLLITVATHRQWKHPISEKLIGIDKLRTILVDEAKRVESLMSGDILLSVHVLDLRPRIPKEK